jgi:hypothetical protein
VPPFANALAIPLLFPQVAETAVAVAVNPAADVTETVGAAVHPLASVMATV